MKNQNKKIREYHNIIIDNKPIVLDGEVYNVLLDKCNDIFWKIIIRCCGYWSTNYQLDEIWRNSLSL